MVDWKGDGMAETMVGRMAAKSASWMVGKKVHWTELLLAAALVG